MNYFSLAQSLALWYDSSQRSYQPRLDVSPLFGEPKFLGYDRQRLSDSPYRYGKGAVGACVRRLGHGWYGSTCTYVHCISI